MLQVQRDTIQGAMGFQDLCLLDACREVLPFTGEERNIRRQSSLPRDDSGVILRELNGGCFEGVSPLRGARIRLEATGGRQLLCFHPGVLVTTCLGWAA